MKDRLNLGETPHELTPELLLKIFVEVTDMRPVEKLIEKHLSLIPPWAAEWGSIAGAIVVGSCANPQSQPKDLDVILVINGSAINKETERFQRILQDDFGVELCRQTQRVDFDRLDLTGHGGVAFLDGDKLQFPSDDQVEDIKTTKEFGGPPTFAYAEGNAQKIKAGIGQILQA